MAVLIGCSKDTGTGGDTPAVVTIIDTTNMIFLEPYNYGQGWDTTNNYFAKYAFYKKITSSNLLGMYTASNSSGTHIVRYVGTEPLFHPDSVIDRGGSLIGFRINPNLKGKPIFEAIDNTTGQLYKRYIASRDSVEIEGSFSIWGNFVTPNRKIGEAFLYYISVKQNDGIKYRKN